MSRAEVGTCASVIAVVGPHSVALLLPVRAHGEGPAARRRSQGKQFRLLERRDGRNQLRSPLVPAGSVAAGCVPGPCFGV